MGLNCSTHWRDETFGAENIEEIDHIENLGVDLHYIWTGPGLLGIGNGPSDPMNVAKFLLVTFLMTTNERA